MLWIDYFRERDTTGQGATPDNDKLWIDYFRERDTTTIKRQGYQSSCGLITLGNEIQQRD